MSTTWLEPEVIATPKTSGRYMVTIFNNDDNSIEEVVGILMEATRCSQQEAAMETWEAHHFGKAPVHFASRQECEKIALKISTIGVATSVDPEWKD
ncbi:MAG: ATP-dependent Clp protease adaptor ClpS [Armatimonadetes bacterium]|nr:ATP-dependent Clp protease adaptor ClpS [Armatimonadota bacterium]